MLIFQLQEKEPISVRSFQAITLNVKIPAVDSSTFCYPQRYSVVSPSASEVQG